MVAHAFNLNREAEAGKSAYGEIGPAIWTLWCTPGGMWGGLCAPSSAACRALPDASC